jgi:hypothetical protein
LTSFDLGVLVLFMLDVAAMSERHAATLARLAGVAEQLAMKHAERALSADDPDIEAKATAAFHRAARSVRQCLALEAKLVRDAARAEREDRADAVRKAETRRGRRKTHVRLAVERLIWTEAENNTEAERFEADLDDLLDLDEFAEGFADEPIEAHIARISRELGLTPDGETIEITADPPPALGDWPPPERRSSA